MTPGVSILLPVRNAAPSLPHCLQSIHHQTYADWELIIVDDGSSDESLQLAQSFNPQQTVVLQQDHHGIPAALNYAASAATTPLLCRMDADDHMHPDRLARQVDYLNAHPETSLVSCRVTYTGDPLTQKGYAEHVDWTNTLLTHEELFLHRFVECPFAHPSVCFRRSAFDRWGGYPDNEEPEDYALWLEAFDQGDRMEKLPAALLEWADPPSRASRTDPRYQLDAFYRLKTRYLASWIAGTGLQPVLWGAGRITRRRFTGIDWTAYVDVDPARIGNRIEGVPVLEDASLDPDRQVVVAGVGNRGARALILERLQELGFHPGLNCIAAA